MHDAAQRLLSAPILPTLLRLSAPNVRAMVMTVLVGVAQTCDVDSLGTAPRVTMVRAFPLAMRTPMMSAEAMVLCGVATAVAIKPIPWGRQG